MSTDIGEKAEREARAQLEIIQALRKLPTKKQRQRVVDAVGLILEADRVMPGVFEIVRKGLTVP